MSAMICASRGFKVHYLGADLPAVEIARFARELGASVIALSVVWREGISDLTAQLGTLAENLTPGTAIWIGGSASAVLAHEPLPAGCVLLRDNAEFERRLDLRPH
jgi:methanogenic corrinoid protein MtbC1